MDQQRACTAFAALAQETRLAIVRLLVRAGPQGMTAGTIAAATGGSASNTSFHLKELERAGLIAARRRSRSIVYAAETDSLRGLIDFLVRDCCSGRPEICSLALEADVRPNSARPALMTERPFNVLFLCTGNSARSIMAEAIMNREGGGRFRAFSAGSQPKGQVHPHALDLLRRLNFEVDGLRPKSWHEFAEPDAPPLDFVFTVCDDAAGESCPVWPGRPVTAHWGVPDPAAAIGTEAEVRLAFASAFRMLENRISLFMSLPLRTLDRLTLQGQLDAIGRTKDSVA